MFQPGVADHYSTNLETTSNGSINLCKQYNVNLSLIYSLSKKISKIVSIVEQEQH